MFKWLRERTAPMIRESVSDPETGNECKWPAVEQRKQQPIQLVVHLKMPIEVGRVIYSTGQREIKE